MAMGPGVDSAMAIMSRKAGWVIHFFLETNSFSIRAIIA